MISSAEKRIFVVLFSLYSVAFGLSLLNRGIFWDDYVFVWPNSSVMVEMGKQMGALWFQYFQLFMLSIKSILLYRILTFVCYLSSAFLLNGILKSIKEIGPFARMIIVIFFALFPVNDARIALCIAQYSVSYTLFFVGFWLLSTKAVKSNVFVRALSLMAFFLAFGTNSLLVFYVVPAIYVLYSNRDNVRHIRGVINTALSYLDYILLPFLFWFIKKVFFVPYGSYNEYNVLQITSILQNIFYLFLSMKRSFLDIVAASFHAVSVGAVIFALLLYVCLVKRFRDTSYCTGQAKTSMALFIVGIGVFVLAVAPYVLVGHVPALADWNSRHQLLVPLGASLVLFYGIELLMLKWGKLKLFVYSLFIALFVNMNIHDCLEYQKDWYKQVALREAFKESRIIRDNTMFIFVDNATGMNADDRIYREYEYTGIMAQSVKEKKRLGIDERFFDSYYKFTVPNLKDNSPQGLLYRRIFQLDDYVFKERADYTITIKHQQYDSVLNRFNGISVPVVDRFLDGLKRKVRPSAAGNIHASDSVNSSPVNELHTISAKRTFFLLYYEYFNHEKFLQEVRKLVTLEFVPFTG